MDDRQGQQPDRDREPVISSRKSRPPRPEPTSEERRESRGQSMIFLGAVGGIWGAIAISQGAGYGFLLFLLGVALLVGGFVVRP